MDEKLCNERYELMLSEIHEELFSLLNRTRRLKMISQFPDELEQMVHLSTEIRHLLVELEHMHVWSQDDAIGRSLSELKLQFLDLEGSLKEQRNDRSNRG
jgi:hypothetical protein